MIILQSFANFIPFNISIMKNQIATKTNSLFVVKIATVKEWKEIEANQNIDGMDGIVGYLTSHEAYCLFIGNH